MTNVLSLQNVVKKYHNHVAVDGVSFDVKKGTIFGLLGPNGAGKTSLIRIITSITAADSGQISINGAPLNALHPNEIGYMPEERGLYKKMKVGDQLLYLAQLKGLSYKDAKAKAIYWLDKLDVLSWWKKDVSELSKGMSQKVQFVATIIHDPSLIILDEPFSGLDPINANLIKDEIYALKQKGTSILFSTHRMEQVEEICEDIVLMNKGKLVLYGGVADIKNRFKEHMFDIRYEGNANTDLSLNKHKIVSQSEGLITVQGQVDTSPNTILRDMMDTGITITGFNEVLPSLNDIFIRQVGESEE
jgi:ABC-2 type transport system ATP-binding protein